MSKLSVDQFLVLVERSGLIPHECLAHFVAKWKSEAPPDKVHDAQACADALVRGELLTQWQGHKLLEGRHRGFQLGNYKLLDHLGSGGMSNVYLAEHQLMQRRVAIKVLPQDRVADGSFLNRFHREGQAVAALDHPNIVRAYDLGSEGRIHYLVMEFIQGSDLEELVERDGPLDFHTAARYVAQAAAGLAYAHRSGFVHRDVKPANLLVDGKGTVKILDMGLAKFETQDQPIAALAAYDEVLGTAEYLAPEQSFNSSAVDARADVYGLGCTLYFLLSGHPPFQGDSATELITAHREQTPPSLADERRGVPEALVAVCRKMMEKDPSSRYQSADDVAEALAAWLALERRAGRTSLDTGLPHKSALAETSTDVQETSRIETSAGDSARHSPMSAAPASASDAPPRDASSPPPMPPVAPPPRHTAHNPIPTVVPSANAPDVRDAHEGAPVVAARASRADWERARRGAGRSSASSMMWTILLSALVLGAVLLALFALAD